MSILNSLLLFGSQNLLLSYHPSVDVLYPVRGHRVYFVIVHLKETVDFKGYEFPLCTRHIFILY